MSESQGRREQKKLATRRALQDAAQRLFAERGYAGTTVQDIAEAAGVTERTFFRYFPDKGELLVDQVLGWLPVLQERIRSRPAEEDPLTAVKHALLRPNKRLCAAKPALWLFRDGPSTETAPRSGVAVLRRAEAAIAESIRDRLAAASPPSVDAQDLDYAADVMARTSLALIRSVLIRDGQLRDTGRRPRPSFKALVEQAFATIQESPADQ
jgi:AcrR family transcriptional regulator